MESVAVAYDLGPLGCLLEARPTPDAAGAVVEKALPVVILDRSGSMDRFCDLFTSQSIPAALNQCGYTNNDEVVLITFDSDAERVLVNRKNPTVGELRGLRITCRGCTNMLGAVSLLCNVIDQLRPALHVIVISDGAISDQSTTRQAALAAVERMTSAQRATKISATLIRFLSSSSAEPDTSALTCIGNFCNTGQRTELIDVRTGQTAEVTVLDMTEAITAGCRSAGCGKSIALSLEGGALMRQSPTADPVATLSIPCTVSTTVLLATIPSSVLLGSTRVPVTNHGVPRTAAVFDSFVELIGQKLRMSILAADGQLSSEVKARVDGTVAFFDGLQAFIRSLQRDALESADLSMAGRARSIATEIKSRTATAIDRLRQQLNANRVATLNAQQKAEWLRGVSDTKSGRAVARRTEGQDPEGDSRAAIVSLSNALQGVPAAANDAAAVSFYSQASWRESIETVRELAPIVDGVGLSDWQKCVGGVGVSIRHHIGDYADPWNVRVLDVYCGADLSECDVFMASVQAGAAQTNVLKCPGRPDSEITAVVPLRSLDPSSYDLYMTKGRALAECQSSAQLRRNVTCIAYDVIALTTATIWKLAQLGDTSALPSVDRDVLRGLMSNLEFLIGTAYKPEPFLALHADLKRIDPRPWLNGENNVSNVLRGMASVLRFGFPGPDAMRALYYLECYHCAARVFRSAEDPTAARRTTLHSVLGIDFAAHATPLKPLFEPESPEHYGDVSIPDLMVSVPAWLPRLSGYIGVHSLLTGAASSAGLTFGCSGSTLIVVAAVQAINSPGESSRIDTKQHVSLLPDPTTDEEALKYLRLVQQAVYAEEYKTRLTAKTAEESRIVTERTVKHLLDTATFEEFKTTLVASKIINRDHPGFQMVVTQLIARDPAGSGVNAQRKLALLITGRDLQRPAEAVWATGNIWNKWKDHTKYFQSEVEQAVIKVCAQYGVHRYARNGTNRHKHGNQFPSYHALGYKDLRHMQSQVSEEEFLAYVRAHCLNNRCCNPNESEKLLLKGFH